MSCNMHAYSRSSKYELYYHELYKEFLKIILRILLLTIDICSLHVTKPVPKLPLFLQFITKLYN